MSVPGRLGSNFLAEARGLHRDVDDPGAIEAEDHPALELGGRVVEVDDCPRASSSDSKVRSISSSRHWTKHLDGHVVGDDPFVDDLALEVVVGLRGGGEAHLDLFEPDLGEGPEQAELALGVHRVDQGLIAVPQVDAGPAGGPGGLLVRPGPIGEDERAVGPVEVEGHRRDVTRHRQPMLRRSLPVPATVLVGWVLTAVLPRSPIWSPLVV